MVPLYNIQQLFDQPANITNGQLLATNPKVARDLMNKLRKPINRKPNKGKGLEVPQGDNPFSFEVPPFGSKSNNDNEASNKPSGSKEMDTGENEEKERPPCNKWDTSNHY